MARTRKPSKIAFAIGGVFAAAAVLWWAVGIPAFVKFPTDLDIRPEYEGEFSLFVDPTTAAPLEEPLTVPMTIERHIEAIGDESGADTVLIQETIVQRAGDLVDTTIENAYVMDRRTSENVADPRAYAFTPQNVVDRSGTYRIGLPFGTDPDDTYPIYKNEIETTYTMRADRDDPATTRAGLDLDNYVGRAEAVPVSEAFLAQLNTLVPLPEAMTLEQLDPQLKAAGVDVDATLAALLPRLTSDDLATLGEIAGNPIPLQYTFSFDGGAAVEPTTGAEVAVGATESLGVKPVMTGLPDLLAILDRFPDVPEAVAASEGLERLASGDPITVFAYTYDQTPASVADLAAEVKDQRRLVLLAEQWLPLGLVVAAALAIVVAAIEWPRRTRLLRPTARPQPTHA